MKNILILGAVVITILAILFFILEPKTAGQTPPNVNNKTEETIKDNLEKNPEIVENPGSTGRIVQPAPSEPVGKLKAANFTGTLQKVDTGCFADGECYVEIEGKHVTALRGWSQDTVGQVLGVDGFGDLEGHIGA